MTPWYLKPQRMTLFSNVSWFVRCEICGVIVSKYDFTLQDTVANGEHHVREKHGTVPKETT